MKSFAIIFIVIFVGEELTVFGFVRGEYENNLVEYRSWIRFQDWGFVDSYVTSTLYFKILLIDTIALPNYLKIASSFFQEQANSCMQRSTRKKISWIRTMSHHVRIRIDQIDYNSKIMIGV